MKYKLLIIFLFLIDSLFASIELVPIAIKNINYKQKIFKEHYKLVRYNDLNKKKYNIRCKEYLKIEELQSNKYRAKHYIRKDKAICKRDLFVSSSNKIKFNFGFLEIEKDGEVIKETSKYIRIKNADGTIEKIYKGIK